MDAITLNWFWFWFWFAFVALGCLICRWLQFSSGYGGRQSDEARPSMPAGDGDAYWVPAMPPSRPVPTLDPVSGERLRLIEALAFFHRGKVYFFASEQTRARFAATSHRYAPELTAGTGAALDAGDPCGVGPTVTSSAVTLGAHAGAPPLLARLACAR